MSDLDSLLLRAVAAIPSPTPPQQNIILKITQLRARLGDGLLRVAILGQFKRGKSTLLNSLVGFPLVPVGVTPVTAIPTFIKYGESPKARITFHDGKHPLVVQSMAEIPIVLQRYVSEIENAHNHLNVERVEIEMRSDFLSEGIVLVDTPGVGSTLLHNTEAAEAVLPQCDAAVFVLSADPPITEVEFNYLAHIRQLIPKIYFALNKSDLLTPTELEVAERFLTDFLNEQITASGVEVFAISAKRALEAQLANDSRAFDASGVSRLIECLAGDLAKEKRSIILTTGLHRATTLVSELLFQSELQRRALLLPQQMLDEKLDIFGNAEKRFDYDQREFADLLSLDRKRLIKELEIETDALWQSTREKGQRLAKELVTRDLATARDELTRLLSQEFDVIFQRTVELMRSKLIARLSVHQERATTLIALMRQTAADLMEIPAVLPEPEGALEVHREPYWVAPEPSPSVSALSVGALWLLLPRSLRIECERKQVLSETETAVLRNIANLDWAVRQNIDEAFRRFEYKMIEEMKRVLTATHQAMRIASDRRKASVDERYTYLKEAESSVETLSDILKVLDASSAHPTLDQAKLRADSNPHMSTGAKNPP